MTFRVRDRASGQLILTAQDCTKDELLVELERRYGEAWVHGTTAHPPRFNIEEVAEEAN